MKRQVIIMLSAMLLVLMFTGCGRTPLEKYLDGKWDVFDAYDKLGNTMSKFPYADELVSTAQNDEDPFRRLDALLMLWYYDDMWETDYADDVAAGVLLSMDYGSDDSMQEFYDHAKMRGVKFVLDKLWNVAAENMTEDQMLQYDAIMEQTDFFDGQIINAVSNASILEDKERFFSKIESLLKGGYQMFPGTLLKTAAGLCESPDDMLRFLRMYDGGLSALCAADSGPAAEAGTEARFNVDAGILSGLIDEDAQFSANGGGYAEGASVVILWKDGSDGSVRICYGAEYPLDYMLRPETLADADIIIVVDEQFVSYAEYVNGGEAYVSTAKVSAYDAKNGAPIAELGSFESDDDPPDTLPYSPYYSYVNYNDIYECIINWAD